jgi:glutamate racemase
MGMDLLSRNGFTGIPTATASSGPEQFDLQTYHRDRLQKITLDAICAAADKGGKAAMIYCNSLSAALDLADLRAKSPLKIVTPLDAHAEIARKHKYAGVLAVSAQSACGLELAYYGANPDMLVISCSVRSVIKGIEAHKPPLELVEKMGLIEICEGMAKVGAECIALGCTHLPYIERELAARISIPVENPDDILIRMLKELTD